MSRRCSCCLIVEAFEATLPADHLLHGVDIQPCRGISKQGHMTWALGMGWDP
jgi:hypothetical protein